MPRALWKGAISFGLVHIPVGLCSASEESEIDFDWIDARSNDPIGYKRVNKRTGREVDREHIVRGVKSANGRYVLLSDEEIRAAFPKTTQTIEIEGFVDGGQIPPEFLERPYYVVPVGKAEKVYALLREAMREKGVVGVARIVMRTKAHLAALIPTERALLLVTLRWASEIRPVDGLDLPAAGRSTAKLKPGELKSAMQLVEHLTTDWKPERYTDSFGAAIRKLVVRKAKAGQDEEVEPLETPPDEASLGAKVVDFTELLRKSLGKKTGAAAARRRTKRGSPPRRTKTRKSA